MKVGTGGEESREPERKVKFVGKQTSQKYPTNAVKTSKYTLLTFLPKNLWEQFHKFGNCYFLLISIVMYVGEKTPLFVGTIKAFSTLGLLVMMMAVTAAMAFYDDIQRKRRYLSRESATAQRVHGSLSRKYFPIRGSRGG
eukprot:TRINITY_DN6502_c0_g1_i1.p1 TRINITY_DN6502_c0_g1~~TRINITY_DN6502_c0_g1_i1.p1  ORF type:complete len:140 (+),score=16.10 TRINITY_DN6502_c0_g1_i1:80-499(+)